MRNRKRNGKEILIKDKCEICGCIELSALHIHHIIPRCDSRCTDLPANLACVCANCHSQIHNEEITIIGVFNSTSQGGRKLLWFRVGEEPPLPKELWKIKDNPLISWRKRNSFKE